MTASVNQKWPPAKHLYVVVLYFILVFRSYKKYRNIDDQLLTQSIPDIVNTKITHISIIVHVLYVLSKYSNAYIIFHYPYIDFRHI